MKSRLILLLLFPCFFLACEDTKTHKVYPYFTISDDFYQTIISDHNDFYVKRTTTSQAPNFVPAIMKGQIYFWEKWAPTPASENIDWESNPYADDSWQLYLHSLRTVSHLCVAYEMEKDARYLDKAISQSIDWFQHHLPFPEYIPENKFIWYDHAVSNRMLTINYLFELYKKQDHIDRNTAESLFQLLYVHAQWLADDDNYGEGNHAIMEDRALLQFALMYPKLPESNKWQEKALSRLKKRIMADVSPNGVHLENSPAYHPYVMDLCQDLIDLHTAYDKQAPSYLEELLEKMGNYLAYVIRPDGKLPAFGDSQNPKAFDYSKYHHPSLDFIASKAENGAELPTMFADSISGVAIVRDRWAKGDNYDQASWLMLQAGFQSTVHKQSDHLSFEWFTKGLPIVIDAGHYSYTKTEYRSYFRSVKAHNNLIVNGKNYVIRKKNIGEVQLTLHEQTDYGFHLQGKHQAYEDFIVIRDIYGIDDDAIIIHDRLVGDDSPDDVAVNFNFPGTMGIQETNQSNITGTIEDLHIQIQSLKGATSMKHYLGSETPLRAWSSIKTLEKSPMHQFEFHGTQEENQDFLTAISAGKKGEIAIRLLEQNDNYYLIKVQTAKRNTTLRILK